MGASEEICKIYKEKAVKSLDVWNLRMFELFHYLNMRYNSKIDFDNIDRQRLNKLMKNILAKFEARDVVAFLERVDFELISGIIEFSFYAESFESANMGRALEEGGSAG